MPLSGSNFRRCFCRRGIVPLSTSMTSHNEIKMKFQQLSLKSTNKLKCRKLSFTYRNLYVSTNDFSRKMVDRGRTKNWLKYFVEIYLQFSSAKSNWFRKIYNNSSTIYRDVNFNFLTFIIQHVNIITPGSPIFL